MDQVQQCCIDGNKNYEELLIDEYENIFCQKCWDKLPEDYTTDVEVQSLSSYDAEPNDE